MAVFVKALPGQGARYVMMWKYVFVYLYLMLAFTETLVYGIPIHSSLREKYIEEQIEELLSKMTLDEKIGQMTQPNKLSIDQNIEDIERLFIGSILSGGGEVPVPNDGQTWVGMINRYQSYAMKTRLKIPIIYGVDAVHGHGNLVGATIFPHNIGLGSSFDPDLVKQIGYITAKEVAASGVHWNFAPAVSVPQDIRWGRTYEGFSENTELVTQLSKAYIEGLQSPDLRRDTVHILATAKHFVGDGGTVWGTSHNPSYKIDQGDTPVDEETLRRLHLAPYRDAIAVGVQTVMVSFSSWQGNFMHSHRYLITDVLKGEMGFDGLVVSDWLGVFTQGGKSIEDKIARSINAGIDMVMAVDKYRLFIEVLRNLVYQRVVPMERIDDAVRRILRVKYRYNLFSLPFSVYPTVDDIGSPAHRQLARNAVQKSAVLLKNEQALPFVGQNKRILFLGKAAHDLGLQSGGWTVAWQGHHGNRIPGTTFLEGVREALPSGWTLDYQQTAYSSVLRWAGGPGTSQRCDYGVVVLAEQPYAEGFGDTNYLGLNAQDKMLINHGRERCEKVVLVLFAGRPRMITEVLEQVDGVVAAWLPGSEGGGLADLLLGKVKFSGRLSFTWPKSLARYNGRPLAEENILYPYGYGLTTAP